MRSLFCLVGLFIAGGLHAQDMPLHEIIKAGETWQLSTAQMPAAEKNLPKLAENGAIKEPSCFALWHGGRMLLVGDAGGKHVWVFRIDADGKLSGGEQYCPLRLRKGDEASGVSALCVDGSNRVYASYKEGIMVFDPTGRPCGVITKPTDRPVTRLAFDGNTLYALVGEQVYTRKMLAVGGVLPK